MTTTQHIFLSYRSTQRDTAARLRKDLEANGIEVWMDNHGGIEGGDDWRQTIDDALHQSSGLVAVLSPEYLDSKWCMRELNRADSDHKPIIPVLIEQVDRVPLVLEGIQWIDFREALNDDKIYEKKLAELIEQVNEKTSITPTKNTTQVTASSNNRPTLRQQRTRPEGCTLYGIITLLVAVVGLILAALALPDDRLQPIINIINQLTRSESAAIFNPTLEEFSLSVEREALFRELDTVSSPGGLVAAPSTSGQAIWGYGAADFSLFAVDVGTGSMVSLGTEGDTVNLPTQFGDNFQPSTLHYDTTDAAWLWIGDSRNDHLIAIDPLNPTDEPIVSYDLRGNPTKIAQTGNLLWITQQDSGTVTGLAVDYADGSVSQHCNNLIQLTEPNLITAEGETTVWVAAQEDESFTVHRVNVQSCGVETPFSFETRITALRYAQGSLWIVSDGAVYQYSDGAEAPTQVELPSDVTVRDILITDNGRWLVTDDDLLLYYELNAEDAPDEYQIEIQGDAQINALIANGRQIWVAREDNTISRYLVPDFVYPDLVDMAWLGDTLWIIDANSELCGVRDESRRCNTIETDADPLTLVAASDGESLWLGLANNRLLNLNPEDGSIIEQYTATGITVPASITPVENDLWVSDLFSATTVITLQNGAQTALESVNVPTPAALAYDGANLWFADAFSGQLFTVNRDEAELRQGNTFALPSADLARLAATDSALWVVAPGSLYQLAPTSGEVLQIIGIGGTVDDLALGTDDLWIADRATGFVYALPLTD